jgi:hypothetical protein
MLCSISQSRFISIYQIYNSIYPTILHYSHLSCQYIEYLYINISFILMELIFFIHIKTVVGVITPTTVLFLIIKS